MKQNSRLKWTINIIIILCKLNFNGVHAEEFQVARNGDALVIPIHILSVEHLFLIDTGFTNTVFDTSLPVGRDRGSVSVETPSGRTVLGLYEAPPTRLGRFDLDVKSVCSLDLERIRWAVGHDIKGILGMDILKDFIVHINFDRGIMNITKSINIDITKFYNTSIFWEEGKLPTVKGRFQRDREVRFVIDTGCVGQNSGTLSVDFVKEMSKMGEALKVGNVLTETASGESRANLYKEKVLQLATFSLKQPVFQESKMNILGLGLWSRFEIILDFPNHKLFLTPSLNFSKTDQVNNTGLSIMKRAKSVLVKSVSKNSEAEKLGIVAGDRLVQVGSLRADNVTLFELRAELCLKKGKHPLAVTVSRRGRNINFFFREEGTEFLIPR